MRHKELVLERSDDEFVQDTPFMHTCSGTDDKGNFEWDGDEYEFIDADPFGDPIEILMRREEEECRQLQSH